MADKVMQVTLTKTEETQDEVTRDMPTSSNPESVSETMPSIKGINIGSIAKKGSASVMAMTALKLAKDAYKRINEINLNDRVINDKLRNYGGAGYSANSFDDRYNVFGKKTAGESVVYQK